MELSVLMHGPKQANESGAAKGWDGKTAAGEWKPRESGLKNWAGPRPMGVSGLVRLTGGERVPPKKPPEIPTEKLGPTRHRGEKPLA